MVPKDKNSPEGLWIACEDMELAARAALQEKLNPFESIIRTCYEAGVQAPTLPGKRHKEPDLLYASLFLKKALNDFRSAWILLRIGYTSQAASVVASLFENALTVTCLAGKPENVQKLEKKKSGDLPWTPQQLSKILARQWKEEARIAGNKFDQEDYEKAWREIYAGYKWLCKIKHPTLGSATHDASVTSLDSGVYVVMAAPDIRPEDISVKATILAIAINRVREALRSFVFALECDTTSPEYKSFSERMQKIHEDAPKVFRALAVDPLPFVVTEQKLQTEWRGLKSKNKQDNS